MKAIVLAAGYGTRMQPLSDHMPKPLLPVVGRPLLWHTVRKLTANGASAVGINCHHKAEMVQRWARSAGFSVPITVSHEPVILGSGGGIGGFRELLKSDDYFLVHNGDLLSDIDIAAARASFLRETPLAAMVLHDAPGFNNVCVDDGGRVIDMRDILKPAHAARRLAYSGICFLRGDILRHIPPGGSDLILVLIDIMKAGAEKIQAVMAGPCAWRDVGTPASYLAAHRDILLGRQGLVEQACLPAASVYAGAGTRIAGDAVLSGFAAIGDSCTIGRGCRLENCIVWDGADIAAGARFASSVIGPGWSLRVQEAA
jgi:NDP-sugar pyrophosphorylase family protein